MTGRPRRAPWWLPVGGLTAAAMIATPLARQGGATRRVLAHAVVGGLFVTTAGASSRQWGSVAGIAASGAIAAGTTALERIGTETGWPFGRYRYASTLWPRVAGVPVIVPLAWTAMALPAREVAHAALGTRSRPAARIALGAVALAAWDVFLDPQMVAEGYWTWQRRGRYRGIPVSNYGGWLVSGAAVMSVLEVVLSPRRPDPVLVGSYAGMAMFETLGFAAFFRDRVVAAAGGAAMLPLAAVAVIRTGWRE